MSPNELAALITSLDAAAELVEAIDEPSLAAGRGWDLVGWHYDLVPWGVRFLLREHKGRSITVVTAISTWVNELAPLATGQLSGKTTRRMSATVVVVARCPAEGKGPLCRDTAS